MIKYLGMLDLLILNLEGVYNLGKYLGNEIEVIKNFLFMKCIKLGEFIDVFYNFIIEGLILMCFRLFYKI